MKKLVALTGAGISAESGIPTFRDSGGLWEGYDVMDVATPQGWQKNPEMVLSFYNERRRRALEVEPNEAHLVLAELEKKFEVTVVTQNVDDLHERAGSSRIIHLHGSLFESRSTLNPSLIYPIGQEGIKLGDKCKRGSQLRPNIVWFGEMVPRMEDASAAATQADIFLAIGTSMLVYPAAGLIDYVSEAVPKYIVDLRVLDVRPLPNLHFIHEKASTGMRIIQKLLG